MNKLLSLFYSYVFSFCRLVLGRSRPAADPGSVCPFGTSSPVARSEGRGDFEHRCFYVSPSLASLDERVIQAVFVPDADAELPGSEEVLPGEEGWRGVWYATGLRWMPVMRPASDIVRDLKPELAAARVKGSVPLGGSDPGAESGRLKSSASAIREGEDLFAWAPVIRPADASLSSSDRHFHHLGYGSSSLGHCLGMPSLAYALDRLIGASPQSEGRLVCGVFDFPYIEGKGFVFGSMTRAGILDRQKGVLPDARDRLTKECGGRYRTAYYAFRRTLQHDHSMVLQDQWFFDRNRAVGSLSTGLQVMADHMNEPERERRILIFAPRDFQVPNSRSLDVLEYLGSQVNPVFRGEETDVSRMIAASESAPLETLVLHPVSVPGLSRVPYVKHFAIGLGALIGSMMLFLGAGLIWGGKKGLELVPEETRQAVGEAVGSAIDRAADIVEAPEWTAPPAPWTRDHEISRGRLQQIYSDVDNPLEVHRDDPIAVRGPEALQTCFRHLSQMHADPTRRMQGRRWDTFVQHLGCGGAHGGRNVIGHMAGQWRLVPGPAGQVELPLRKGGAVPLRYRDGIRIEVPQNSPVRDWLAPWISGGRDPAKLLSCGPVSFWGRLKESGLTAEQALAWLVDGRVLGMHKERIQVESAGREFVHESEEQDLDQVMLSILNGSGGPGVALGEVILSSKACRDGVVFEIPSRSAQGGEAVRYAGRYQVSVRTSKPPRWAAIPFEIRTSRIAELRRRDYGEEGIFRAGSPLSFHALYHDRDPDAQKRAPIARGRAEGGLGQYVWRLVGWFLLETPEDVESFTEDPVEFPQ